VTFRGRIRYYCQKLVRLKGEPHQLALGMAFGIFSGLMPIMPFQIATAVALSLLFRGSKITAALGTWVSNPFDWYFIYYYSYRLGALVLRLREHGVIFSSVMGDITSGEKATIMVGQILGAGSSILASFLVGGLIIGVVFALPSYFLFLGFFRYIKSWRESREGAAIWRVPEQ